MKKPKVTMIHMKINFSTCAFVFLLVFFVPVSAKAAVTYFEFAPHDWDADISNIYYPTDTNTYLSLYLNVEWDDNPVYRASTQFYTDDSCIVNAYNISMVPNSWTLNPGDQTSAYGTSVIDNNISYQVEINSINIQLFTAPDLSTDVNYCINASNVEDYGGEQFFPIMPDQIGSATSSTASTSTLELSTWNDVTFNSMVLFFISVIFTVWTLRLLI